MVAEVKRKLLWIGDTPTVSTGFGRATQYTVAVLQREFDVTILGLNYQGDPHAYPCAIYPCAPGGDWGGLGRMKALIEFIEPDVLVVQQDPWNFPEYMKRAQGVPMVGAVAVDGKNCKGVGLNGLAMAVFWTHFGEAQARIGGYVGPSSVVPLGVDLDIYKPIEDCPDLRIEMGLNKALIAQGLPADAFVVGVVGRNQQRKRLDLTIEYFAEWIHSRKITDAALWLHVAPTGERAYDIEQLCEYYGITKYALIPDISERVGMTEELLNKVYNVFDVLFTTTQGEGFWLPGFEAMAAGTPIIAPDWSAIGELFVEAAALIPCAYTAATPNKINVIGALPDKRTTVNVLHRMYTEKMLRDQCREAGLKRAYEARYRWENVGEAFLVAVEAALKPVEKKELVTA